MSSDFHVAIVGGGPAGLALAIALRRLGRKVVVLEKTRYDRPRPGETFGGDLRPLLASLGVRDAFDALESVPFRGVQSAWGGPELTERASIFHPFGDGWHVDRARFDRCLAECAARAGAAVEQGTGACTVERDGDYFRVRTAVGQEVTARYIVDASGRGAPASALHFAERKWLRVDRLVAVFGKLSAPVASIEPILLLEAVEEGWWYSVPQPDGLLLAALITDADLLPGRGRAALAEDFSAALARTVHTSSRAAGGKLAGRPWIVRADSGLLLPDRGPSWRALGDAAMGCDPLAGDGVVRSLRSALEAAPQIDRALEGEPDDEGSAALHARFRDFLEMRGSYYSRERRWPAAMFWARRRPLDWQNAPLFLEPSLLLRSSGEKPPRDVAASIESLVPAQTLYGLVERLRQPAPAHEALSWLKQAAPLEDKRLLVALHYLVHCGALLAG